MGVPLYSFVVEGSGCTFGIRLLGESVYDPLLLISLLPHFWES